MAVSAARLLDRHLVFASELAVSHRAPRPLLVSHPPMSNLHSSVALRSQGSLSDLLSAHPTLAVCSHTLIHAMYILTICGAYITRSSLRATVAIELHGHHINCTKISSIVDANCL